MEDILTRVLDNIIGRASGPLTLRLILQPLTAAILAMLDGIHDARRGWPAYLWALMSDPQTRNERIRDGRKSVGRVFVLALLLDVVYQIIALRWIYPLEALIMATLLAVVPYVLIRGPVNRIASHWIHRRTLSRTL